MARIKRIGILGGSFDPVHKGHLRLANAARKTLMLDRVIFVPVFISPFKRKNKVTPVKDRLQMLRLSLKGSKWASISDYEIKRKEVSYTVHTINYFKKKFGAASQLFIILGSDSFKFFHLWKDAHKIIDMTNIAVAKRPGPKGETPGIPYHPVQMPQTPISSSAIRALIQKGRADKAKEWVNSTVWAHIKKRNLYSYKSL